MGITGLLPALKSVVDQVNLRKYSGETIGIDASGWLYHGAYSCAKDLVLGHDTDVFLNYSIQQIELFRQHNIRPLFVFDGASLPAKTLENEQRHHLRAQAKAKAIRMWQENPQNVPFGLFAKAMTVTNDMSMRMIQVLRNLNVDFMVAPYEADAQLAFLSKTRVIDAVISEDSDCIPYGCKAVLFKWSSDGWADEIRRKNLGANEDLCFVGWSEEMFLQFCVLCGCDYCPSVYGVGIKTAHKLVEQHRTPPKILRALRHLKSQDVPVEYETNFAQAILTFRHHLVFDPRHKKLRMLTPLTNSDYFVDCVGENLEFLGDLAMSDELAMAIANAQVNPFTHETYAWMNEIAALEAEAKVSAPVALSFRPSSVTSTESNEESMGGIQPESHETHVHHSSRRRQRLHSKFQLTPANSHGKENDEDSSSSKPELRTNSTSSWRHLDSVLGSSSHILNFGSPNISANFRSLVAQPTRAPSLHNAVFQIELKRRVRTAQVTGKRKCGAAATAVKPREDGSKRQVFNGQVSSRVKVTTSPTIQSRSSSRSPSPRPPQSVSSRILDHQSSSPWYAAASEGFASQVVDNEPFASSASASASASACLASPLTSPTSSPGQQQQQQSNQWSLGFMMAEKCQSPN